MNFAKKKTFPNFLVGILLVCYKGYLSRTNPVEKASVAICSVKKHKMPVLYKRGARSIMLHLLQCRSGTVT